MVVSFWSCGAYLVIDKRKFVSCQESDVASLEVLLLVSSVVPYRPIPRLVLDVPQQSPVSEGEFVHVPVSHVVSQRNPTVRRRGLE